MSGWQHTTTSSSAVHQYYYLISDHRHLNVKRQFQVLRLNAFQSSTDLISRSSGFGTGSEHGMISDMTGLHVLDQHLSSYWSVCGQDPQWSVVSGGCVRRQLMDVLSTVCASTRETDILRSDQWHSSSKLSTDTQHLVHHLLFCLRLELFMSSCTDTVFVIIWETSAGGDSELSDAP